jgi:hypothetical protein
LELLLHILGESNDHSKQVAIQELHPDLGKQAEERLGRETPTRTAAQLMDAAVGDNTILASDYTLSGPEVQKKHSEHTKTSCNVNGFR